MFPRCHQKREIDVTVPASPVARCVLKNLSPLHVLDGLVHSPCSNLMRKWIRNPTARISVPEVMDSTESLAIVALRYVAFLKRSFEIRDEKTVVSYDGTISEY